MGTKHASRRTWTAAMGAMLVAGWSLAAIAEAGSGCGCAVCAGQASGPACGPSYQVVQKVIQVPETVWERRVVNVTECRTEIRERTVQVARQIPEVRQVRDVFTVMVPQSQVRVETYQVAVPVWREVVQNITVQVPTTEMRQGVRQVCRQVQVQEMRSVCRDLGHWEETVVEVGHSPSAGVDCGTAVSCGRGRRWSRGCGGCASGCGTTNCGTAKTGCGGGCGSCGGVGYDAGCAPVVTQQVQRVWKPNLVEEKVPVMVWRNQLTEEPYEYPVTVYHPEVRQQTVKVCEHVMQERRREVPYTICVAQQRETIRNVTTYRTVMEPRVEKYTVQVPHVVQKEVTVPVCRMVEKVISCQVPVADCQTGAEAAPGCRGCGGAGCRRCR